MSPPTAPEDHERVAVLFAHRAAPVAVRWAELCRAKPRLPNGLQAASASAASVRVCARGFLGGVDGEKPEKGGNGGGGGSGGKE